jgi:hypothetical protein
VVYHSKKPVWIGYFQLIDFTADVFGSLVETQISELQNKHISLFGRYLNKYKDHVIMRLVTCGNNFVSGEHGFAYNTKMSRAEAFFILEKICAIVSTEEKLRGTISATLVKDFYYTELPKAKTLEENKFIGFTVEPNMLIEIPEGVNTLDDYIQRFSKKYRNRAKNVLKSKQNIEIKELSWQEIKKHETQLYKLYENVFEHAKFKLVKLAPNYFSEMKRAFADVFFVEGYFLEDKLVAFSSGYYLPDNTLEAHYIGIDYTLNKEYALYQNILCDFVSKTIQHKSKLLNLGRTAAEIKSTIGAKASELMCYVRPQNTVSKAILKPFINYLQPTQWIPRNPFKEA